MNKMHIFIYLDSAGWEILNKNNFLPDILRYRYQVRSQLGHSVNSLSTVLTGEPPNVHKHLGCYYYSQQRSLSERAGMLLHYLPNGETSKAHNELIAGWCRSFRGVSGHFDHLAMSPARLRFFDYAGKQNIFDRGGIQPVKTILDHLHEKNIPYMISDWFKSEQENLHEMLNHIKNRSVQFCLLFMSGMDHLLHHAPNDSRKITERLKHYEQQIRNIIAEAHSRYDQCSLSVISGHGITPLKASMDIKNRISKLGLKFGKDYVAFYDPTMVRFWYLDPKSKSIINELLHSIPHARRLTPEEMRQYNINFADNMYGETVLLMEPGYQVEPNDHFRSSLPGMHGYAPEHKDSFGAFLSTHHPSATPTWIGDFYHIMRGAVNDCNPENILQSA